MAQNSMFWTTNDVGDGPAEGYTMAHFYNFVRRLLTPDAEATQGVLYGVEDELVVSGTSSPLSLAAGAAIVHGVFYENTAPLSLTVTTPSTGTTGGRINLKMDWELQTVRAEVLLNTDGNSSIPALVQTTGARWDLPLYTFTITTGGAINLTRVAAYCQFASIYPSLILDAVAGLSVIGRPENSQGESSEITATGDNQVLRRSGTTLGFGQVESASIADLAVTTAKIANDAVDDAKAGDRIPQFYRRQGGNEDDWSIYGTTTYTPGAVRMQAGSIQMSQSANQSSSTVSITFPVSFANKPLVIVNINSNPAEFAIVYAINVSLSAFTIVLNRATSISAENFTVNWLAIGPE